MDFYTILEVLEDDQSINPFAGKPDGEQWIEGLISVDFLNTHFGQFGTAQEMIDATESEGLRLYFAWLKDQGKLP